MATDKSESLHLYKFLCQKIGSEQVVRLRRLTSTIGDTGAAKLKRIYSGSKGEGLKTKGSDLDLMYILPTIKIYESPRDIVTPINISYTVVMDTEDVSPCFTKLRLIFNDPNIYCKTIQKIVQIDSFGKYFLSSKLIKMLFHQAPFKIHGPCLSDHNDVLDLACVLQCNQWISPAQPWITRSRRTWPSPDIISKITSCGVLFVPVGYKGSVNEEEEWRISFSIAEKFLIFSFNHTQLLCYALLKIVLKEIVEKQEDLKGLLCSYFLKTLMFWIIEESHTYTWRPDNIISCFKACLQRLIYCIQYSTLLHYFIPDNNLFYLRFNSLSKHKLISILDTLYQQQQGLHWLALSETLSDYPRLTNNSSINEHIMEFIEAQNINFMEFIETHRGPFLRYDYKVLLCHMLHYSRTDLSVCVFTSFFANAYKNFPETQPKPCKLNNKVQYYKYKYDLSHLLIGVQSDAVSGWIKLASYFYVKKNYITALLLTDYSLWKCTDEKIDMFNEAKICWNPNQKYVMKLTKHWKLYTVLKMLVLQGITFTIESPFIPPELQMEVAKFPVELSCKFPPKQFAHFLRFLCYFHLHDLTSCTYALHQLEQTSLKCHKNGNGIFTMTFLGIAYQMIGETSLARQQFCLADQIRQELYSYMCN
ncbi:uncharacterized protein [Mytilus edulis]|uniref:uncharacterized protein n=1 Tax=Mytilus edulis TaxID=6550 RepID=UPI0039EEFDBC